MQKQQLILRLRFLLIGLLVVGLVWAGMGLLDRLRGSSSRLAAISQASQISLGLIEFAIDYDGLFPSAGDDSNSAYRQLFSEKFTDERLFYVPGSGWHDSLPANATGPDGEIGVPPDYLEALTQGENHWAYVNGLNNGSKGNLPIIVDGFTKTAGVYSLNPGEKGCVVHGDGVVIVRVDGSAKISAVSQDGKVYERRKNGQDVDVFSIEGGMDPESLRNPL